MIKTENYELIKKFLYEKKNDKNSKFYQIKGSIGIGKTCGLALAVHELRNDMPQTNDFILYINNPPTFDSVEFGKELAFSLKKSSHLNGIKTEIMRKLDERFKISQEDQDFDKFFKCLSINLTLVSQPENTLIGILTTLAVEWEQNVIVIIDQQPQHSNQFMTNFIQIIKQGKAPIRLFECCSRHVEEENIQRKFGNVLKLTKNFSEKAANTYLSKRLKSGILDSSDEDITFEEEILKVSRLNPLEISEICSFSHTVGQLKTKQTFFEQYREHRERDLDESISQFESNPEWIEYLAMTHLNIPIEAPVDKKIDQNFAYFAPKKDGSGLFTLEFWHPPYKNYVMKKNCKEVKKKLQELLKPPTRVVLKIQNFTDVSGKTRGEVFETNFLNFLTYKRVTPEANRFNFRAHKKGGIEATDTIFEFIEHTIFHTEDHSLGYLLEDYLREGPPKSMDKQFLYRVAVFIPDSKVFEGIDIVFVDRKRRTIFLAQTTINIQSHRSKIPHKRKKENEEGSISSLNFILTSIKSLGRKK